MIDSKKVQHENQIKKVINNRCNSIYILALYYNNIPDDSMNGVYRERMSYLVKVSPSKKIINFHHLNNHHSSIRYSYNILNKKKDYVLE